MPLDSLWSRLETDPKVIFHLLPREGGSQKRSSESSGNQEQAPTPPKKPRKGTGKGKTKALKEPSNLPEELAGLSSWTKTGKRRCWGFNMASGCTQAKVGQACPKGLRHCMRCGAYPNPRLNPLPGMCARWRRGCTTASRRFFFQSAC